MTHSTKLLLNTVASYFRIGIHAITALISTRIALNALGVDDYGLYNLIAGAVSLLAFIQGSLMISAQRFYSIAIGAKKNERISQYFNSSIGIHIFFAILLAIVLIALKPVLFDVLFNIEESQQAIGRTIYNLMIVSSMVTMISIPYAAMMNAKEDLVALSLFTIASYLIQLLAAIVLLWVKDELLLTYTLITLSSVFVLFFMEWIWCRRYREIQFSVKQIWNSRIIKEMLSFVGWNTLGSLAVVGRNQGSAVVLNHFFGAVVNSAYGIANQVNSFVLSFASALTSVFTPSIIQNKGANDEKRMLEIAVLSSKTSFLVSSLMSLPIIIFLSPILTLWLKHVPEYTYGFTEIIILTFLIQQLYPGINRAIYAAGKVGGYLFSISVFNISILPVGYWLMREGMPANTMLMMMMFSQVAILCSTIYFAYKFCNLDWKKFVVYSVIIPIVLFAFIWTVSKLICGIYNNIFVDISICMALLCIYTLLFFEFAYDIHERKRFKGLFRDVTKRLRLRKS